MRTVIKNNGNSEKSKIRSGMLPFTPNCVKRTARIMDQLPSPPWAALAAFDAHADKGLGGRTGGAKDGNGGQGFVIKLGDQECFFRPDFLPYLPNLNSLTCHLSCHD